MDTSEIDAITFDAAGTLIRPEPSVGAVYTEILARHGGDRDPVEVDRRFIEAFRGVSETMPAEERLKDPRSFWLEVVRQSFGFGNEMADNAVQRIFEDLWHEFAKPERWRVTPDAPAVLRKLKDDGFRLVVLSNNDSRLRDVLEGLELATCFEEILISCELGVEKPQDAIFRRAEEALKLPPQRILHIGDDPVSDGEAPVRNGWKAALVNQPAGAGVPAGVVRLDNLSALVPATRT